MSEFKKSLARDSIRICDISREQKNTELEIIIKNNNDQKANDNMLKVYICINFCIVFLNIFIIFFSNEPSISNENNNEKISNLQISIMNSSLQSDQNHQHIIKCIDEETKNCIENYSLNDTIIPIFENNFFEKSTLFENDDVGIFVI